MEKEKPKEEKDIAFDGYQMINVHVDTVFSLKHGWAEVRKGRRKRKDPFTSPKFNRIDKRIRKWNKSIR